MRNETVAKSVGMKGGSEDGEHEMMRIGTMPVR